MLVLQLHLTIFLLRLCIGLLNLLEVQHGTAIGAPIPLAGHANHRGSRRSALRAIAAAAAELDAVISAASADTTAVWLSG